MKSNQTPDSHLALVKSIYRSRVIQEKQCKGCDSLHEITAASLNLEDHSSDPESFKALNSHFSSLIQYLASKFSSNKIKLNNKVETIDYTKQNEILIKARCAGETKQKEIIYSCDYVIVTMPLGFLKKEHANIFAPPLPSEKIFAIERLGFGCVNKLFIVFERAVLKERHLREGVNFLEILWRDDLQFELNSNIKWNLKVSSCLYSRRFNYQLN